jgi:MFS family permease
MLKTGQTTSTAVLMPVDIKHAKRWMVLAEIPGGFAWAGIGITFLTGFFLALKASTFQLGLLTAIPALCSLATIFSSFLLWYIRGRKLINVVLLVLFYLSFALLGSIPFLFHSLPLASQVRLGLLVLAGAYIVVKIHEVYWYPWSSAIVPDGQRGSFFGRLMITSSVVAMPASFLIGKYLDHRNDLSGFIFVFVVCGIIGALAGVIYTKVPDVPEAGRPRQPSIFGQLKVPLRDRNFRHFLMFLLFNTLAGGLCGPFTSVFMIEKLRVPYTSIALFGILSSLSFILFVMIWGYLVDKYGSRPILLLCATPAVFLNVMWIFNTPDKYWLIPVIFFLSGITTAGIGVALPNLLMGVSTGQHSAGYITIYQIVLGLTGFAAPLLGSAVIAFFGRHLQVFMGFTVHPFHVLFGLAGLLSILPLFFIVRLYEPQGKTAMFILQNMVSVNPLRLAINIMAYHRSFSQKDRLSATIGLGSTGSPMVVSELVNTLDDPNYFVRREAALALGRIKDRDAVPSLIAKLGDECADIQYESAWALGKIRDDQSIPSLLESLHGADPRLRGYAATALGEIGASIAIEPLLNLLENSRNVFETTCVANALSQLGYKKALWKTLEKLVASDQPVVRRQLSVSLGDLLGEHGQFYKILTREEKVYGDEVGRIFKLINSVLRRRWRSKLNDSLRLQITDGLKSIQDLYNDKKFAEALREVVKVCDLLFGQEFHRYNETQAVGRKFLHELLGQNEALGNRIYWEECLLSIYGFYLVFNATRP